MALLLSEKKGESRESIDRASADLCKLRPSFFNKCSGKTTFTLNGVFTKLRVSLWAAKMIPARPIGWIENVWFVLDRKTPFKRKCRKETEFFESVIVLVRYQRNGNVFSFHRCFERHIEICRNYTKKNI